MIAEFHEMLTPDDCQLIIDYAVKDLKALTVVGSDNKDKFRVGDGTWVYNPIMNSEGIDLNRKIQLMISEKTGIPEENQEKIHVVHYGVGGEYKQHHDFFHANVEDYEKHISRGGQRSYSALFYLNDGFEGGETRFVKKNIDVKPRVGKLLLWTNMKEDKTPDYDSLHAGMPVTSGEKWIAIVWVREGKFQ